MKRQTLALFVRLHTRNVLTRSVITVLCLLMLSACQIPFLSTNTPEQPLEARDWPEHLKHLGQLEDWRLRGKIGYHSSEDGGSAYIDWLQSRDSFHITLTGPLGQGTTIISGNAQGAKLESVKSGTHLAPSPEQLLYEHTGITLPVSQMLYWVKGMPSPAQEEKFTLNPQNTLNTLAQQQWQLNYSEYQVALGNLLPTRIKMKGDDIKVTLVVKSWENLPEETE